MSDPTLCAALVILAGAPTDPAAAVASNIEALRPQPDRVERARMAFEAVGVRALPGAGHAFSIEAPTGTFEATFHVRLAARDDGGMRVLAPGGTVLPSLPLDPLPASLRAQLQAVLFSEPPAFGPGHMP